MRPIRIGCIVEGHAEVASLPRLLPRLGAFLGHPEPVLMGQEPFRLPRGKLRRSEDLRRAVEIVRRRGDAVLVIADADDVCPAQIAPQLLHQVRQWVPASQPCAVVLAQREFEAWFIAGAQPRPDLPAVALRPESVRDAKGWVANYLCGGTYEGPADQPRLAAAMDLSLARANSPSFAKLCRDLDSLLASLRA